MKERFGLDVAPHERPPVPWYDLGGLWRVAREQLWSMNLLRNLDRRETFRRRLGLIDLRAEAPEGGDFWFDFLSDTGDGGSATTAVAQAMLAPSLQPQGTDRPLPAGRLLVLGGDLAYPGASPEHYQARLIEPLELARPQQAFDEHKIVVAIPQNHDWMDSLSTFCRYFVNPAKAGLLNARTPQTRSYFALALPHGWTLLGFDFALTGDLDREQFDAFRELLRHQRIPKGSAVILLYPEPYWTRPVGDHAEPAYPLRYQRLEALLLDHGCRIRMRLAGDLHHYVRESLPDEPPGEGSELVTCGSGGAFGHPTHALEVQQRKYLVHGAEAQVAQADLLRRVRVGRSPGGTPAHDPERERVRAFDTQRVCFPEPAVSRRRAWGNLWALLRWRNIDFAAAVGLLLALASLLQGPLAGLGLLLGLLVGLVAAATVATDNDPARLLGPDALLALPLVAGSTGLVRLLMEVPDPWPLRVLVAVPAVALLFGGFLAVASAVFGRVPNNAASALGGEHDKGFLRLRVHAGGIEVFMLGIDEVPRRWQRNPGGWPRWRPEGPAPRWKLVDRFDLRP
jgi:hypothetical protein